MCRSFVLVVMAVSSVVFLPAAKARDWAQDLFSIKSHNFGTVAVGSDTTFRFPIFNNTNHDIVIGSVRTSCGCTTATAENNRIAVGTTGAIVAKFNTGTFRGQKGATITVVFNQPRFAEVRLRVDGYIRQDLVFNPGAVDFGTLQQGSSVQRKIAIAYAGRDDWRIMDIENSLPFLRTQHKAVQRGDQRVNYELLVTLTEEAPPGTLLHELVLVTNDRSKPRVPIRIVGQVEAGLLINPSVVSVGAIKQGEVFSQRLVVRGRAPFLVESIRCEGWDCRFDPPTAAKATHVLNVEMVPIGEPGELRAPLVVLTTQEDQQQSARVLVTAEIRPRE